MARKRNSSWEKVSKWYGSLVGEKGHYYHQHLILPFFEKELRSLKPKSVLDIACGQGVFARILHKSTDYLGLDLSSSLIKEAKSLCSNEKQSFLVQDVTKAFNLGKEFELITLILAIQDMENIQQVFTNAYTHLKPGGSFFLVMNHPSFRVPRQSSWEIDEEENRQYRRVDSYMSPLRVPIQTNPSKGNSSKKTFSFHRPLSSYCAALKEAGFLIADIQEWISPKHSYGKQAKRENKSRKEFPLFLCIEAKRFS